jgi:hypothetical protein
MRGGHAGHLRRLNLERVQAFAMECPRPFTRAELIQATGLSAPTVGSLVSHLIRRELVRDLGPGPSRGGRRPFFMEFNERYGFVAGIAVGRPDAVVPADLRASGWPTCHADACDLGPRPLLTRIATATRALLREAGVPAERPSPRAGAPGSWTANADRRRPRAQPQGLV